MDLGGAKIRVPSGRRSAPLLKFVIWTTPFDDTEGGSIALHHLCKRLTEAGQIARIWPNCRPWTVGVPARARLRLRLSYAASRKDSNFPIGPFRNRLASWRDCHDGIVIYPEIVSGNPLGAKRVVRWFLHRPGFHTGQVNYGRDELYFFFQDAFNDPSINQMHDNRLTLYWMNEEYYDRGYQSRSGSCYLMKKGAGREIQHDLSQSVLIDGMTHSEKADQFNVRERFYSYDLYTMYSHYAACCGCIPIIVPDPCVSKSEWYPNEEDRYGIAYGEDDIPWAIETRPALMARLRERRLEEDRMLDDFITKCRALFGDK